MNARNSSTTPEKRYTRRQWVETCQTAVTTDEAWVKDLVIGQVPINALFDNEGSGYRESVAELVALLAWLNAAPQDHTLRVVEERADELLLSTLGRWHSAVTGETLSESPVVGTTNDSVTALREAATDALFHSENSSRIRQRVSMPYPVVDRDVDPRLLWFEVQEVDAGPRLVPDISGLLWITPSGQFLETVETAWCAARREQPDLEGRHLRWCVRYNAAGGPALIDHPRGPSAGLAAGIAFMAVVDPSLRRPSIAATGGIASDGAVLTLMDAAHLDKTRTNYEVKLRGIRDHATVDVLLVPAVDEDTVAEVNDIKQFGVALAPVESIMQVPALLQESNSRRRAPGPPPSVILDPIDNLWELGQTELHGREKELDEITKLLTQPEARGKLPHVIWGEAGMGKSVLAAEVAAQLEKRYRVRWWVDADSEIKIRAGLRELARRLGISSVEAVTSADGVGDEDRRFLIDLHDFLESQTEDHRLLVILDNVDDAHLKHGLRDSTLKYLAPRNCDVLITSQSGSWPKVATTTAIVGLDSGTAAKLVAEESERPELEQDEAVKRICDEFGGRPLFLKQIAAMLRDEEEPGEFLSKLEQSAEDALELLPGVEGFGRLASPTYELAIAHAERARQGSRQVLEILAFFSPEPIPQHLPEAAAPTTGLSSSRIRAALRVLGDRSLIRVLHGNAGETRSYVLHRIVSQIIRNNLETQYRADRVTSAARAIETSLPSFGEVRRPEGRLRMMALAPHIESVASHVASLLKEDAAVASAASSSIAPACSLLGLHRRQLSEWEAAQQAHEKSVELSNPQSESGELALRQVRLANVMRQRGFFDEAQALLESALPALKERGQPHDYAWGLTVQARIMRVRPDSSAEEALPLLADALALMQSISADPSLTRQRSELHGYLSVVHRQLSRYTDAEVEATEGLCIITGGRSPEEVLDAEDLAGDPLIATHLRALGGVWRVRGQLKKAMQANQRALEILERSHGPDHTDVGRVLDSLGRAQREWGNPIGAESSFERAAEISDKRFGPDYPHAGTAAVNLALVFFEPELYDLERALVKAETGLRIYRRAYGESNLDDVGGKLRNEATAWALFVRADILAKLDDLGRALRDHEYVLAWRQNRQARAGDIHAHTASSHFAIGDVLLKLGREEEGLQHHERALELRDRVFEGGPNYWLAQSQSRFGELTGQQTLLLAAYETFREQLRPGHWRTEAAALAIEGLGDA